MKESWSQKGKAFSHIVLYRKTVAFSSRSGSAALSCVVSEPERPCEESLGTWKQSLARYMVASLWKLCRFPWKDSPALERLMLFFRFLFTWLFFPRKFDLPPTSQPWHWPCGGDLWLWCSASPSFLFCQLPHEITEWLSLGNFQTVQCMLMSYLCLWGFQNLIFTGSFFPCQLWEWWLGTMRKVYTCCLCKVPALCRYNSCFLTTHNTHLHPRTWA